MTKDIEISRVEISRNGARAYVQVGSLSLEMPPTEVACDVVDGAIVYVDTGCHHAVRRHLTGRLVSDLTR